MPAWRQALVGPYQSALLAGGFSYTLHEGYFFSFAGASLSHACLYHVLPSHVFTYMQTTAVAPPRRQKILALSGP